MDHLIDIRNVIKEGRDKCGRSDDGSRGDDRCDGDAMFINRSNWSIGFRGLGIWFRVLGFRGLGIWFRVLGFRGLGFLKRIV